MNTYKITIETTGEDVVHEIEASKASVNYKDGKGFIEAIVEAGHFKVIRLPDDWVAFEAEETLGEEEQKLYDEQLAQEKAMAEAQSAAMAAQQQQLAVPPQMPPQVQQGMPPVAPVAPVVPPGQ
jgi:hypothetical protein